MGRIMAPYGVQGWVKLRTFTQEPDGLAEFPVWWLSRGDDWQAYPVAETRMHGGGLVARLEGVEDRDAAFRLCGLEIAVPRDELPTPAQDEYYWADLIGLEVRNLQGEVLGRIQALLETGANDVLVVRGECERLLPYVPTVVLKVDVAGGQMIVDWGVDY